MPVLPTLLCFALAFAGVIANADSPLPALGINKNDITVSGISAGGYMAVQLHVAYSSLFRGAGIIAAGPYWCANSNVATALSSCMTQPELINVDALVAATGFAEVSDSIDSTRGLKSDKVWLFSGKDDSVVKQGVVTKLAEYYMHYLGSRDNMFTVFNMTAEHAMVTENYGNPCTALSTPFINNCGIDAAGAILNFVSARSPLPTPKTTANPDSLVSFSQARYIPGSPAVQAVDVSLGETVYAYIPEACNTQRGCALHVALHGCEQTIGQIGMEFILHSGYMEWAEANDIVVLFPQAVAVPVLNPKGCFDWWGYTGAEYATKLAPQLKTIKSMIDQLAR